MKIKFQMIIFLNIVELNMSQSSSLEQGLLFPKLRCDMTVRQKIKASVLRRKNNYFLNMDKDSILTFHEKVRPTRVVSREELDKWLNKNQRCLNKKLAWASEMMDVEEDLAEFKTKLENNQFRSVAEGSRMAARLYSLHCNNYNPNKSVVLMHNGARIVKKKKSQLDEFNTSLMTNLKTKAFDEVLNLLKMSTQAIKNEINLDNPSLIFARKDLNEIERDLNTNQDRLAILVICKFHKIIKDIHVKESD